VWRGGRRRSGRRRRADPVDRQPEQLRDEVRSKERVVGDEHLGREHLVDLADVVEMRPGVCEEDLLQVEPDALGALELLDLGEVLGEVVPIDLRRVAEGQVWHVELGQALGVARTGVEAHVVALEPQVAGDAGERQEMAVERHRGEEDPHYRLCK